MTKRKPAPPPITARIDAAYQTVRGALLALGDQDRVTAQVLMQSAAGQLLALAERERQGGRS